MSYLNYFDYVCVSCSVVPDSSRPHGLQSTRLLGPWDFSGKDTGVVCHFLLQFDYKPNQKRHFLSTVHLNLFSTVRPIEK